MLLLGILALGCAQALADSPAPPPKRAPTVKAPSAASLGLAQVSRALPDGGRQTTFTDITTGTRLVATYGPLGDLQMLEERTPGGSVRDRRTIGVGEYSHEEFNGPEYVMTRTSKEYSGVERTEITRFRDGKQVSHDVSLDDINRSKTDPYCIPRIRDRDHAIHMASGFRGVSATFSANRINVSYTDYADPDWSNPDGAGQTFRAGWDTEGCSGYPGGEAGLAADIEGGMTRGLNCLSQNLGPRAKVDAARLLAFIQSGRSGMITCNATEPDGAYARAVSCPDDGAPGMRINTTAMAERDPLERRATMFHEMLHWLGYKHYCGDNGGVDMPYLAQACCFRKEVRGCDLITATDRGACGLTRTSGIATCPNPSSCCPIAVTGVEYSKNFAMLMMDAGSSGVARASILAAAFRAPRVRWSADGEMYPDASALFAAMIAVPPNDSTTSPFIRMILGRAAAGNVVKNGDFIPTETTVARLEELIVNPAYPSDGGNNDLKRRFAMSLGTCLNKAINGWNDSEGYNAAYEEFLSVRTQACAVMDESERSQVNDTFPNLMLVANPGVSRGLTCILRGPNVCTASRACL